MHTSVDFQAFGESLSRSLEAETGSPQTESNADLREVCRCLLATRGRNLRGRLLLAAAHQGPRFNSPQVRAAANAIELLHLASLAHDDVIDSGTLRRGAPTVGAKFGQRAAAFAGASLFAHAVETMAECGSNELEQFAATARDMCDGGMRELRDLFNIERTPADCGAVAKLKTASAFRLAARLGAGLSGAEKATVTDVTKFGLDFGIAYQIWDDLVDLLADPTVSGKTPGSDLRHGVYTLPVIHACEEDAAIRKLLGAPIESDEEQARLVAAVKATGGVERAADAAAYHAACAAKIAGSLPRPEPLRDLLDEVRKSHLGLLP